MTENVTNALLLEVLKKMQGQLSNIQWKLGDVGGSLSALEEVTSSMSFRFASAEVTVSSTHKRIDRVGHWLDRIETRLGLIDA